MARLKDLDGTPVWKWNKKAASVNVANLNSNIIQYLDTLPQSVQERILATSGNDSGHAKTSRHYNNNALDLRYDDTIWQYVAKDPNRLKFGLTLIDPDHGSAKHIHLSHGDGSENKKDVWVNPYSNEAKDILGMQSNTTPTTPNPELVGTSNTQIFMNDTSKRDEFLQGLQAQIRKDSELDMMQKQAIAADQERQQLLAQRFQERNNILDAISSNNLEFEGRNYKPNQYFAEGGRVVDSLDEDLDFMINNLKGEVPNFESPEYNTLIQENEAIQNRISKNMELYDAAIANVQPNQPTIVNNETYGAVPVSQPASAEVSASPDKVSQLPSTKGLLYSELKNLGLNDVQVSGVIGSLGGESHENISHTAKNPTSGAFGIAQWLGPRYRNLVKFSNEQGLDINSPEAQVKFLVNELKGSERGALNSILRAKSLPEATEVWTRKFERPSESEVRGSLSRRVNYAQKFLNSIS